MGEEGPIPVDDTAAEIQKHLKEASWLITRSEQSTVGWATYLLELIDIEEGQETLVQIRELIDDRLVCGGW